MIRHMPILLFSFFIFPLSFVGCNQESDVLFTWEIERQMEKTKNRLSRARQGGADEKDAWMDGVFHETKENVVRRSVRVLQKDDVWSIPLLEDIITTRYECCGLTAYSKLWQISHKRAVSLSRKLLNTNSTKTEHFRMKIIKRLAVQGYTTFGPVQRELQKICAEGKQKHLWGIVLRLTDDWADDIENEITIRRLQAAFVCPQSPAYHAGVQAGDVIVEVNGVPETTMDMSHGLFEPHHTMHLVVERKEGEKHSVTLQRQELPPEDAFNRD